MPSRGAEFCASTRAQPRTARGTARLQPCGAARTQRALRSRRIGLILLCSSNGNADVAHGEIRTVNLARFRDQRIELWRVHVERVEAWTLCRGKIREDAHAHQAIGMRRWDADGYRAQHVEARNDSPDDGVVV